MDIVSQSFRPEFINRIDDMVVFHALDKTQIEKIAQLQIAVIQKRLKEKGYQLKVDETALAFLSKVGFDPAYGARPLKRAIQQYLENPLAEKILSQQLKRGVVIQVVAKNNQLYFE
jgi:ATP-dependent Clp protease ATP-binding subunit ClpB